MVISEAYSIDNFIANWNGEFPDFPLTAADFKNPYAVMAALHEVFKRLDIDVDTVLSPEFEDKQTEHTAFYKDLLPVINMTRIIKHLVSVMPEVTISITHFLQPSLTASQSILLLLFNFMVFNQERLREIALQDEELFAQSDHVKTLEEKKNGLVEMLNIQAVEKGKRAEIIEKLHEDKRQFKEELKQEKEAHGKEKQPLETILKENHQVEVVIEKKKGLKEAMLAEIERKRALRVYDADDIKAQVQQAALNVQEAVEKLNTLQANLMQKDNSLKNLQTIKPCFDTGNNLLHEMMELSESLKDYKSGDLDSESMEGELDVFSTELAELESHLAEGKTARAEVDSKCGQARDKSLHDTLVAESALKDAKEKDKKDQEKSKKTLEQTQQIKELTVKYTSEKNAGMEELARIKSDFMCELKTMDEALLKIAMDVKKIIEEKIKLRDMKTDANA